MASSVNSSGVLHQSEYEKTSHQAMAEQCQSKCIPISEDTSITKADSYSKALDILAKRKKATLDTVDLPNPICFGAGVEWLRCYFAQMKTSFDCQRAESAHQEYFSSLVDQLHLAQQKYDLSQEHVYHHLTKKMKPLGLNVRQEEARFNHIKSMGDCLSGILRTIPRSAVFVTLHAIFNKDGFYQYGGHTFILAMKSEKKGGNVTDKMIFFDCSGIELNWKKVASEPLDSFMAKAMYEINTWVAAVVKDEAYECEEFRACYIYEGAWPRALEVSRLATDS